ncbi:MAG: hypothetical protein HXY38_14765 [Chloroflexi bacterium]|nr:hypothetical protein [Chloroflexota bacterium]
MTFQPPSRSLTTRDYVFIIAVVIFFLAISAGLWRLNTSFPAGGGEFLRHWAGARAFVFERIDPYSAYVPDTVQTLVYDGRAGAGADPYILDTPFHIFLLYIPFSPLADPMLARAVYTLILEWALFALAILSLRLTEWPAPRWFLVLFFLVTTLNFYSVQALLAASPILLLGLSYAGILFAFRNENDESAGALMAISLYYWEAGLPFLVLMAWRAYKEKRLRVFAGFGMISIVLLAVSFLLYPDWIIPCLRAGWNALQADFGYSVISALSRLLPLYGEYLAWGVIALLVFALGYEWNALQVGDDRRLYWAACLSLAAAPLLGFRSEVENLSVLVIPLAFVFAIVYDRWRRINLWLTFLLFLLATAAPWALHRFLPENLTTISNEILFLFLPIFTILGLYWIRWWAIRPPRVWADTLTNHL